MLGILNPSGPKRNKIYLGELLGEVLTTGVNGVYSTIELALDYVATKTYKSEFLMVGSVATSQGSEIVIGSGTSFLTDLTSNDFILINGNLQAVRAVVDDENLTLWHGAMATETSATVSAKQTNHFTIKMMSNGVISANKSIPNGVGLTILGENDGIKLTSTSGILGANKYWYLRFTHLNLIVDAGSSGMFANAAAGASGASRGIFVADNFYHSADAIETLFAVYGSAITFTPTGGTELHCLFQSDYLLVDQKSNQSTPNDVILFDTKNGYDIAYEHELINIHTVKIADAVTTGSMYEINVTVPGKIANIRNSYIAFVTTSEPAGIDNSAYIPIYSAPQDAIINIIDSVIHVEDFSPTTKTWYDVYDRYTGGGGINIINSFRGDGTAIRILTN